MLILQSGEWNTNTKVARCLCAVDQLRFDPPLLLPAHKIDPLWRDYIYVEIILEIGRWFAFFICVQVS